MRCPNCRHTSSKVVDSRHADEMNAIRRRRECDNCVRDSRLLKGWNYHR